jgi:hypothetical protein
VFLDATYLHVRRTGQVTSMAVVVATGVTADGGREVLGCDVGDSEDEVFWAGHQRLSARGRHLESGSPTRGPDYNATAIDLMAGRQLDLALLRHRVQYSSEVQQQPCRTPRVGSSTVDGSRSNEVR